LPAVVFDATGFVANQAQTPEALMGIRVLFTFVPAAFAVLGALLLLLYPLNDKLVAQIERDLAARGRGDSPPAS
jgi:Na+/melibiose symporter-like transporter